MVNGKPVCDDNWGIEEVKRLKESKNKSNLTSTGDCGLQSAWLGSSHESHKAVRVWHRQRNVTNKQKPKEKVILIFIKSDLQLCDG